MRPQEAMARIAHALGDLAPDVREAIEISLHTLIAAWQVDCRAVLELTRQNQQFRRDLAELRTLMMKSTSFPRLHPKTLVEYEDRWLRPMVQGRIPEAGIERLLQENK